MRKVKKIGLAIPTYNREEVLVETLKHVMALDPQPEETLVIDQTEEHGAETNRCLRKFQKKKGCRLIHQQPPSLTAARNRAIAETECDILVFIDDDVELPKDFVARHSSNYRNPRVDAVAGGVRQENQPQYPKSPAGEKRSRLLDYKYFSVYGQRRIEGVATFMGCNHSAKVEVLRKLGGYDTNYLGSAFREDTDMAVRIWKSGGLIVFDPTAWLFHLAAPTGGCRMNVQSRKNPEWWVPFNRNYFAFRHLFPKLEFWRVILFVDFRQSVLRKANFKRPWKIPWAFMSYFYSVARSGILALKREGNDVKFETL